MKVYNVKLKKIESTHNKLRSDVIEGQTLSLPEKGKGFVMVGEGIEFGSRFIETSEIKNVELSDGVWKFDTLNSKYELEVISEDIDNTI